MGIRLIFFLFLNENVCCGYSLEAPHRGASNEYQQHTFSLRKISILFGWKKHLIKSCDQWIKHQWLVYRGWFKLLIASSRKQMFRHILTCQSQQLSSACDFKVIFANSVDPDPLGSVLRVHTVCLYAKIDLKSLQEYSADDINRQQMQVFLAF